jgi:hypothetical protein
MMNIKKTISLSIIALILCVVFGASSASAESTSTNAAQGMQISPTLVDLNASRGKTYEIKLNVVNITSSNLVYTPSVDDFTAANETGAPKITTDSNLPTSASIKTWVTTVSKLNLKSQQQSTIKAQITIPDNAEPGGHYGVLRFSGAAPELETTGVGLSASAGVLILIRVDGAITEKADVASFYTATKNTKADPEISENSFNQTSFFEESPVLFVTRIKNDGNIHIKPFGNIEVRDMFGGIVKTLKVNESKSNVLPKSTRLFEAEINKDWMFGKYTANLSVGYGTTGQALTNTITFWVIPYKLIFVALIIITTLIYIFSIMLKSYNKRIIQKSKNEESKSKKRSNKKG